MIKVDLHYIRKHSRWLACCQISIIWVSWKKSQKSNIGWPPQPRTEKMLEFNMIFYVTVKTFLFTKHQNEASLVLKLLNSRTWITLKSLVVIFQALETSPDSLTSAASATSLASSASTAQFRQKTTWSWWSDLPWHQNDQYWSIFVEWIIKNFTDIWNFLCWRLLRPVYVTFLNFFWWNSNGGYLATW